MKNEENSALRFDMAELQMRLKQYEKAERTISQALEAVADSEYLTDDSVFGQSKGFEFVEHLADLRVHVRNAGKVGSAKGVAITDGSVGIDLARIAGR